MHDYLLSECSLSASTTSEKSFLPGLQYEDGSGLLSIRYISTYFIPLNCLLNCSFISIIAALFNSIPPCCDGDANHKYLSPYFLQCQLPKNIYPLYHINNTMSTEYLLFFKSFNSSATSFIISYITNYYTDMISAKPSSDTISIIALIGLSFPFSSLLLRKYEQYLTAELYLAPLAGLPFSKLIPSRIIPIP